MAGIDHPDAICIYVVCSREPKPIAMVTSIMRDPVECMHDVRETMPMRSRHLHESDWSDMS